MTDYLVPLLLLGISLFALRRQEDAYDLLLSGAAGIRKSRYTVPAALFADFVGFLVSAWSVRFLFPH